MDHVADYTEMFRRVPELAALIVACLVVIGGMWRIIDKVQKGQEVVVDRFLDQITTTTARHEKEMAEVRLDVRQVTDDYKASTAKLMEAVEKNTVMLARTSKTLEQATEIIADLKRETEPKPKAVVHVDFGRLSEGHE